MAEKGINKAVIIFPLARLKKMTNTYASYKVSKLIAERIKPFSDREFFQECMLKIVPFFWTNIHYFLQSARTVITN